MDGELGMGVRLNGARVGGGVGGLGGVVVAVGGNLQVYQILVSGLSQVSDHHEPLVSLYVKERYYHLHYKD